MKCVARNCKRTAANGSRLCVHHGNVKVYGLDIANQIKASTVRKRKHTDQYWENEFKKTFEDVPKCKL